MDTVYLTGMLKDQPFKMEGDKVFGLGILDDKQGLLRLFIRLIF
jgi:glutamate carboxypeptidase